MANIPTYCRRKHGIEQPEYIHPKLEPILRETYGVIVYQEQVMQAAQVLSGYSLGEADLLRRAMGKKIRSEMQAQRTRFVSGASSAASIRRKAVRDLRAVGAVRRLRIQQEHAAAYALVAYQTAYMKANYPVEIPRGVDDAQHGQHRQAAEFRAEAERLAIKVEPPSINRPEWSSRSPATPSTMPWRRCAASAGRRSRRSLPRAAMSLSPTLPTSPAASTRAPSTSGCSKALPPPALSTAWSPTGRASFAAVDAMLGTAQRAHETPRLASPSCSAALPPASRSFLPALEPWLPAERLQREYDAVGFFLSGHPLDDYAAALKRLRVQPWSEFARAVKGGAGAGRVAGTVVARTERRTKNGTKMGIIGLSDPSGQYEAVLFAEGLRSIATCSSPGARCCSSSPPRCRAMRCARASSRSSRSIEAAAKMHKGLRVFLRNEAPIEGVGAAARADAEWGGRNGADHGDGEVSMVLMLGDGNEVEVKLPGRFKVSPQIAGAIKAVSGVVTGGSALTRVVIALRATATTLIDLPSPSRASRAKHRPFAFPTVRLRRPRYASDRETCL
jgi:DNA polymerase-3 subunit alpha